MSVGNVTLQVEFVTPDPDKVAARAQEHMQRVMDDWLAGLRNLPPITDIVIESYAKAFVAEAVKVG